MCIDAAVVLSRIRIAFRWWWVIPAAVVIWLRWNNRAVTVITRWYTRPSTSTYPRHPSSSLSISTAAPSSSALEEPFPWRYLPSFLTQCSPVFCNRSAPDLLMFKNVPFLCGCYRTSLLIFMPKPSRSLTTYIVMTGWDIRYFVVSLPSCSNYYYYYYVWFIFYVHFSGNYDNEW